MTATAARLGPGILARLRAAVRPTPAPSYWAEVLEEIRHERARTYARDHFAEQVAETYATREGDQ